MAEAFWNSEVESELRMGDINFKFTEKSDREAFMDAVDRSRANNPYAHTNCSEECRKRGNNNTIVILVMFLCNMYSILHAVTIMYMHMIILQAVEPFWSLDGNWKLTYPICMYQVPKNVPFGGTLQYVSSCPKQPVPNMAFCVEHCEMARKQKIPSELHE